MYKMKINCIKSLLILFVVGAFFMSSCGSSDADEVVDCWETHFDQGIVDTYSTAITAFASDPDNEAACEAAGQANNGSLNMLLDYSRCIDDNNAEAAAGFENIDETIMSLEMAADDFEC